MSIAEYQGWYPLTTIFFTVTDDVAGEPNRARHLHVLAIAIQDSFVQGGGQDPLYPVYIMTITKEC